MRMNHHIAAAFIATGLLITPGCATEKSQSELQARARISSAQAQQTALAKTPGGSVKSSELEEEDGKLVWSFEIAVPGSKDITEVLVDAITGEVVATETETAEREEKEEQEERKGKQ